MLADYPILTTERLILRPPEIHDAPNIQHLAGDRLVAQGTLTMPHPLYLRMR